MKSVFFYGLFMDKDILKDKGLNPTGSSVVCLADYGLRIGERATLEHSKDERTFGSVMQLSRDELEKLYADKSVMDYVPQQVVVTEVDGESMAAISYILPMENVSGSNSAYAKSLALAAKKIGLPEDYIREIEAWIKTPV